MTSFPTRLPAPSTGNTVTIVATVVTIVVILITIGVVCIALIAVLIWVRGKRVNSHPIQQQTNKHHNCSQHKSTYGRMYSDVHVCFTIVTCLWPTHAEDNPVIELTALEEQYSRVSDKEHNDVIHNPLYGGIY